MGIDIPFGIEPEVSKCDTCGKEFRKKRFFKTITGKPMNPDGSGEIIDASDQLALHEIQEHGYFARNGFSGIVNRKTLFTVGEGGKKEYVNRKKVNVFDVDNMFNDKQKKKKSKSFGFMRF